MSQPSADDAMANQESAAGIGTAGVQVSPEFVEMKTSPAPSPPPFQYESVSATSLLPSAEEATEDHPLLGAPVRLHVAPASAEQKIAPSPA
jgi:hypothetical protein